MDDSSSFSSLLALVDNHLSKTRIQATDSRSVETGNNVGNGITTPSLHGFQNTTQSETSFPQLSSRLPLPSFGLSQSPIKNVLSEQIANMLKAKEKKQKEEEEEQVRKELEAMEVKEDAGSECVIDLMKALGTPFDRRLPIKKEVISSSSSLESLFEPQLIDFVGESTDRILISEPLLPCSTDLSYILKEDVSKGKCSSFGKVLISRYKTPAAPYFREKIKSDIIRFNFNTRSPCDLIKDKLRKTGYNTYPTEFSQGP